MTYIVAGTVIVLLLCVADLWRHEKRLDSLNERLSRMERKTVWKA